MSVFSRRALVKLLPVGALKFILPQEDQVEIASSAAPETLYLPLVATPREDCCEEVLAARGTYATLAERLSGIDQVPGALRLAATTPCPASEITLHGLPDFPSGGLLWLIIDPFSPACEIRKIASINGSLIGLDRPLVQCHDAGEAVLWTTEPVWNVKFFGARTEETFDTSESLRAAIADQEGTEGRLFFPPGSYRVGADVLFDAESTIVFEPGASLRVDSGVTVTIQGTLVAGRQQIFSGEGAIRGPAKIEASFPEWFGARGAAGDELALQKAVDFFPVVQGDPRTEYLVNCTLVQWHTFDLHRAGIVGGLSNPSRYEAGYWYGVRLPSGSVVQDCKLLMSGDGNLEKAPHAFACGDPTSATRHQDVTIRGCTFKIAAGAPRSIPPNYIEYRGFVAQSVDRFLFVENRFEESFESQELVGGFLYDCRTSRVEGNHCIFTRLLLALQFCVTFVFRNNLFWNCHNALDADKRNDDGLIEGNIFDRETRDTDNVFTDAVFEFNATQNVVIQNNIIKNARRYAIISGKDKIYESWSGVLTQSGPASYGRWKNFHLAGNLIRNTDVQAIFVGDTWRGIPHPGAPCGEGLYIQDTFLDCAASLDTIASGAVIDIAEGRAIRLHPYIDGSSRNGVFARSWTEGQVAGAGSASTLEIEEFGGLIRNCAWDGVYITDPARLLFSGLVLRNNGRVGNAKRQMLLANLDERNAAIRGSLDIHADAPGLLYGAMISALDFRTGGWRVELFNSHLQGHTSDLHLISSNNIIGTELIAIRDSLIGTTNLDSTIALRSTLPTHLSSDSPPLGSGSSDAYHALGTIVWNTTPTSGGTIGWVCVAAGRPGTWKPFGAIGA
ncbi:MAG: right-handed parallel beta-helix repeat-containing protein [Ardenticatenales bacterium]|nr:right-handed parallel beta-helix repeat-containing protein [Ardenticatenales bacterium]